MNRSKEELINLWYGGTENCIYITSNNKEYELILGFSEGVIDIAYLFNINSRWEISVDYRINNSKKIDLIKEYIKNEKINSALKDSLKYEILYMVLKTANERDLDIKSDYEETITSELNKFIDL